MEAQVAPCFLVMCSTLRKPVKIERLLFTSSARWIQKEMRLIGEPANSITPLEWDNGHIWCENLKAREKQEGIKKLGMVTLTFAWIQNAFSLSHSASI